MRQQRPIERVVYLLGGRWTYLLAFQAGTLPEAVCDEGLRAVAQTITDLRCREGELTAEVDDQPDDNYDNLDLAELQGLVDDILTQDDDTDLPATRAHFQQLIEGIEVDSHHAIRPTFRVPAVRDVSGLVGARGLEPPT